MQLEAGQLGERRQGLIAKAESRSKQAILRGGAEMFSDSIQLMQHLPGEVNDMQIKAQL
jgi:hypothetical protein